MTPPLEQQVVCRLCGARHLSFAWCEDRQVGDRARAECVDCGFEAVLEVAVLYDPDLYTLQDPYGDGGAHQYTDVDIPPVPGGGA